MQPQESKRKIPKKQTKGQSGGNFFFLICQSILGIKDTRVCLCIKHDSTVDLI